jgi:hypothetical protein
MAVFSVLNLSGQGVLDVGVQKTTSSVEQATGTLLVDLPIVHTSSINDVVVTAIPEEMNLSVPFMLQAPKQNWDMPYQEACEEASMLMVKGYYSGKQGVYTPDEADKLIVDFVNYQTSQGLPPDITAEESKRMMQEYLGLARATVIENPTADQLKGFIAKRMPIILPASGKLLNNPNFRNGGPNYHMLVIKGYTKAGQFIVNDPGTRKGADYVYSEKTIMNAMHDWNGGDVVRGAKRVIVVQP